MVISFWVHKLQALINNLFCDGMALFVPVDRGSVSEDRWVVALFGLIQNVF